MNTHTHKLLPLLLIVLLTSLSAQSQDTTPAHDYVGTKACKMCHNKPDEGKQYSIWKSMKHARAYSVLLGIRAKEIAAEQKIDGLPHESPACLKCHVTAYNPKTKLYPPKIKKEEGVQCESCHGPASGHLLDGKAIRIKKDTPINVLDNLIHPTVHVCIQCHNDQNPTWNPEKYTLKNGTKTGFDFKQALKEIDHKNPKKSPKE